jgi:3-methylfumaryl-CoA hydratase
MITPITAIARCVSDWKPGRLCEVDMLTPTAAQRLQATLDCAGTVEEGHPLPLLWHWVYFTDWPKTSALGPDGHPTDGHFLPPIPNRRRMFAGGRLKIITPLLLGLPAERSSIVTNVAIKSGRTGELMFVTVRYIYRQRDEVAIVEEQDIVYRSDEGPRPSFLLAQQPLQESGKAWATRPVPQPPLLFRFSALTANSHRIHYDEHYATKTEGYPALVVHGPLLAIYMAELTRSNARTMRIEDYEFRLSRPVFVGDPIEVQGEPDGDSASLAVVSGAGTVHASASVRFL